MKCSKCNEIKKPKDFYSSCKYTCKKCLHKRTVEWQAKHPKRFKEICKKFRSKEENKKKQREYYEKWYAEHGRGRSADYRKCIDIWKKLNPEKCNVSRLVYYAVKTGKLKRPKSCSKCKKHKRTQLHHDDYNYPLKGIWLCASCHKLLHSDQ